MNKIQLFLLLILPISTIAQDKGLLLGVQFSHDEIKSDNYIVTLGNINGYIIDRSEFNFRLGVSATKQITNRLNLKSGVLFSNKDFSGYFNCASCDGFRALSIPTVIEQRYLSIPLNIEYELLKGRIKPVIALGFVNNFNLKREFIEAKNFFLEGMMGLGLTLEITSQINFNSMYSYSSSLSNVYFFKQIKD
ncbi:MAG: hypothetical protein ABJG47_12520 [Ekhidna sp.]